MDGSRSAEPFIHTAEGLLLKGGYILSQDSAKPQTIFIDTTFCLPVNYQRGIQRLMNLPIREYLSRRLQFRKAASTQGSDAYFLPPSVWANNYYHFLVEVLPAVHWAIQHTSLPILIPAMTPFFQRFLDFFGWEWQHRIQIINPRRPLYARFSGLTNIRIMRKGLHTLPNPALLEFYKDLPLSKADGYGSVLIVSRKYTGDRGIRNEEEIFQTLSASLPCEVLVPEREDFLAQLAKIQRASVIVGSHGAGLTNMLFNPRLKGMVEITYREKVNESYLSLCEAMGIRHQLFIVADPLSRERYSNRLIPSRRASYTLSHQDIERLVGLVQSHWP